MRNTLFAASLFGLLSGCHSPEDIAKTAAESAVSNMLKDPDSAKFSNEFIVRTPSTTPGVTWVTVCGLVNGKNSFGAYGGVIRFLAVSSESRAGSDPAHPHIVQVEDVGNRRSLPSKDGSPTPTVFESVYWNSYCVDANHRAMVTGHGL